MLTPYDKRSPQQINKLSNIINKKRLETVFHVIGEDLQDFAQLRIYIDATNHSNEHYILDVWGKGVLVGDANFGSQFPNFMAFVSSDDEYKKLTTSEALSYFVTTELQYNGKFALVCNR